MVSILFALAVVLETICLGWSAADERSGLATYILRVLFSLYNLILAVRSVNQTSISTHAESIIHLSALTVWGTVLSGATAILPAIPPPVVLRVGSETLPALRGFWYTILVLYFIASAITSTTPQGPPLHYPPNQIYSEKTIAASTNVDKDNVCGITGVSSLSLTIRDF
jgi:hypothetical protein